jgi:hypothetical protein
METNFLYVLAAILVVVWLIGVILSVGALINLLLIVAAVLILMRVIAGRKGRPHKRDIPPPRPV